MELQNYNVVIFYMIIIFQDAEERCYSDSLAELPEHDMISDGAGGVKKARALNLVIMKTLAIICHPSKIGNLHSAGVTRFMRVTRLLVWAIIGVRSRGQTTIDLENNWSRGLILENILEISCRTKVKTS